LDGQADPLARIQVDREAIDFVCLVDPTFRLSNAEQRTGWRVNFQRYRKGLNR
jgi:hypothetical protein